MEVNGGGILGRAIVNNQHNEMGHMKFIAGLKDVIKTFNSNFDDSRAWALAEAGILELNQEKLKINQEERDATKARY